MPVAMGTVGTVLFQLATKVLICADKLQEVNRIYILDLIKFNAN